MPWLRVDDGAADHPKLVSLSTDSARWNLLRLWCYCARYSTRGHVSDAALRHLKISRRHVEEYVAAGLVERDAAGELLVHDWPIYNGGTVDEKVAAYLRTNPDAGANEVHRVVGGRRELVLDAFARYQESGSPNGSAAVPGNQPTGSPSRARAVPSRPKTTSEDDDLQL